MGNFGKLLCILAIALLSCWDISAQQITASIRGTVVDASGGVVQGAWVNSFRARDTENFCVTSK